MNHRSKVRYSKLALGLAIALATAPAMAQQTSANIGGRVTTAEQAGVANAQITILHVPSGTVSQAVTDANGRYVARGLRVGGPYTITVTKDGKAEVRENVFLRLSETTQVDLTFATTDTVLEAVEVTATDLGYTPFSATAMGTGTTVTRQTIDQLPSIGRNIQDYMRLDPRIAQTDKERTEISAGGQNTRFNNIRVDGITVNDGFGLESNNLTTAKQPISLDAIEELNISLANYDVALAGYTGANVDAVTKAGTNEFKGSVYGLYRDGDWARTDAIPGSFFRPPQKEQTAGMTFGGPLIKDRLFFFLAYENFERVLGAPNTLPAAISSTQIDQFRQAAQSRYGIDVGDFALPGELKFDVEDIVARIDWNIADGHRAYLRYNRSEQVEPFLRNIGARSLSLSSHWQTNNKLYESVSAQLFSDWTDVFTTEFKVGRSESSSLWDLNATLPQIRLCWGASANASTCAGSDSIYVGAEQFRHVNILETETTNVFGAGFLFLGNHEVKFGVDYQRNNALNLFGRDVFGVYNFGGATFEQALARFIAGTPTQYNVRYPINGDLNSLAAQIKLDNYAFFVQDTWSVNYNLTLNFGLRYDLPKVPNSPPANPVASQIFGYDNTNTIDGNGLLQPRFGFNYTFDTERPTQLRGGIGLFSGAAANVWLANPFQNNGGRTLGEVFSSNGAGIVFNPNPNAQPGIPAPNPNPAPGQVGGPFDIVDGDLEQPSVWKANLAIEHELPWHGIIASGELLLTSVKTGLAYEALNNGRPSFQSAQDGRLFYWGNPFTATNARANRDTRFTDVTVIRPTNKGDGQQLTLSLSKPLLQNWGWSAAYTFTSATEVNPLTSSQAISNWANSFRVNPNEPIAARSVYEVRDRLIGTLTYRANWFGQYPTTIGAFYEGRSGRPFSYSFINDANGDGRVNDLLYVPSGRGDVIFTGGAAMEAAFFDYLARNPQIARFAGRAVDPGSDRSPWVNSIDLRITQALPGFFDGHSAEVWFDLQNVGNLINKDWGRIEEIGFPFGKGIVSFAGIDPATGRYRYTFNEANIRDVTLRDNRGESRWSAQIGFRYRF
ncbi:TonB-dependent receptor [Silanimonas lenta]|uniref:TonB-dependent receptor n=1 Tax=Silanimonas lenta TaxID=265429 RepID=UPI00040E4608|nr:TonB-dependent receptor [Silanimonas lenta]